MGGLHCTGFDVLSESMVIRGCSVAEKHGLQESDFSMKVEDLLDDGNGKKPLDLDVIFDNTALVWLNDKGWPLATVEEALSLVAVHVGVGAAVVSYGSEPIAIPPGLQLAETIVVPTSWNLAEAVRIFAKV